MTYNILGAGKPVVNRAAPAKKITEAPKFPRLADPDAQADLMEEYGDFAESLIQGQDLAAYLSCVLQAGFTTQCFFHSSPAVGFFSDRGEEPNSHFSEKWYEGLQHLCTNGYLPNLKITPEYVQLFMPRTSIPIKVDLGNDVPADNIREIVDTFKKVFPKWSVPTIAERTQDTAHLVMPDYTSGFLPCQNLLDLKFDAPLAYGAFMPERDEDFFGDEYKSIRGALDIRVGLKPLSCPIGMLRDEDRMALNRVENFSAYGTLTVDPRITIPMEMALWMTHCTKVSEFVPTLFLNHLNKIAMAQECNAITARTMSMETVAKNNSITQKQLNYTPKVRTNKDHFAITTAAGILFVPPNASPTQYNEKLRLAYNPETGAVVPLSKVPELAAIPVSVDWMNDVFSYTSTTGELVHQRIRGAIPLDDVTIGRYLRHNIDNPFGNNDPESDEFLENSGQLMDMFIKLGREGCTQLKLYPDSENYILQDFGALWGSISTIFKGYALANVFDTEKRKKLIAESDKSFPPVADEYIATMTRLCRTLSDRILSIGGVSVITLCLAKFTFHLIGYYTADSTTYLDAMHKSIQINTSRPEVPDSFKLPSLPGLKSLMQHQAEIAVKTDLDPKMLTLDVAPGGGKTASTTVAIIQLLQKHANERVGIIVPDVLVKEWYSFISWASQNQINCVCLTAKILEKTSANVGWDRKKFIDYVHGLPTNSVCIIGMNLLNLKRDVFDSSKRLPYVMYGDSVIEIYPNTLLARQLGLSAVYIDESQRAKNEGAILSRNIKQVRSEAERSGILSGTLVGNLGSDLVNQFALNSPMILGDHDQFIQRYGLIDENGKFLCFKRNAPTLLAKDGALYTSWSQKTRADWAYVLPKILMQYYQVKLTPAQQKWNDQLIDEAIQDILNDPKIKALLKAGEGDDDAQEKLENAIKAHLARVEIFINAPDARPKPKKGKPALFFADTADISEKDLVSPKVGILQQLIYSHFHGGELKDADGNPVMIDGRPVVFRKQSSKIIVFCYHIDATDHIFRHLRVPGINILKYQAGDEEAITKFKEDPRYQVLVASENSMREGLNLQVASRVIRTETLWTEGAEEQAISRVMRPDVVNKYNRSEINVDILLTTNTMEMSKRARLISKMVLNTRVKNFDENFHRWMDKHEIDQLPILRMNLKAIKNINNSRDLRQYFFAQSVINEWEDKQFDAKIATLKKQISEKRGIAIGDVTSDMVKDYAMKPITYTGKLPGSKQVWTPIPNGATPYDPRNLGLSPLSIVEENEEDEGEEQSSIAVEVGDLVWTEYGFGKLTKINSKTVKAIVPVVGNVTVSKQAVFIPTDEKAKQKLQKDIKTTGGISFINGGDPETSGVKVAPPKAVPTPKATPAKTPKVATPVEEPETPKVNKDKIDRLVDKSIDLHVYGSVLNGNACVQLVSATDDTDELKRVIKLMPEVKWRLMPEFGFWHIKRRTAVAPVIEMLESNFRVPSTTMRQFENLAQQLYKKGSSTLAQHKPLEWGTKDGETLNFNFSNFYKLNHTKSKFDDGLKIYPMVEDGDLYLVAMIDIQRKQLAKCKRLMTKLASKGVSAYDEESTSLIHNGATPADAEKVIKMVRSKFTVEGSADAIKFVRASKRLLTVSR